MSITDPNTGYFLDGKRKIHFVIVVEENKLSLLQLFVNNIHDLGIKTEEVQGQKVPMIFVLIHIPNHIVRKFAKVYDIILEEPEIKYKKNTFPPTWLKKTPISELNYQRKKGNFTNVDRIIILDNMLETTRYGNKAHEVGLTNLKKLNIVVDSYPLHDAPLNLKLEDIYVSEDQDLEDVINTYSERELLYRYWGNFRAWNCEIPLGLIKKYFGIEVAFYFEWLQYFNIMLTPVAILGLLVVIISFIILQSTDIYRVIEICEADNMYLCPNCFLSVLCTYKPISSFCTMSKWTYAFDNRLTISFATFMSFWATIFLNVWRRKSNVLRLIWNIKSGDPELNIRTEYTHSAHTRKFSYVSEAMEPFVPTYKRIHRILFVVLVCMFMLLLDIAVLFILFYVQIIVRYYVATSTIFFIKSNKKAIVMIGSGIVQVTLINILSKTFKNLSKWLTEIENPRTQKDFNHSLLYKIYLLSFANNYTIVLYTAFLKGSFYVSPHYPTLTSIQKDTCQPLSCIIDLTTQLFFLMLFRKTAANILSSAIQAIKKRIKKRFFKKELESLPQYEEEYFLKPTGKYFLIPHYNEMIIQYGFITFFVAAFPLAPLYALISIVIEMRIDAHKLIKRFRRPIPKTVTGIGAWDGILLGLTYLSTAINAFIIAFSSQFIQREVYRRKHNTVKGFVNYTLSEFATKDYSVYDTIKNKKDICYYHGMRYPSYEDYHYGLTGEYWTNFTWKLVFLVIFEHLVLMSNSVLSYFINDVPAAVKEYVAVERQMKKEALVKLHYDHSKLLVMPQQRKVGFIGI